MTSMKLARGGGKRGFARHVMLGSTAVAALALAAPADATTYTVTDQASLIAAINAANASAGSDTIILANDISMSALMPVISDSLVIDGGGYALTNDQRLFFVDSAAATVDIANFSALTGSATGGAGGNQAGGGMGAGGAIFVNAGTVNLSNVSFDGNAATGGAGGDGLYSFGGGGGGGLGGDGGMSGGMSGGRGAGGGGGGFSGGGGGAGGTSGTTTYASYNYYSGYSTNQSYSTVPAGTGGAGAAGAGGSGGTGTPGNAGFDGGAGGDMASATVGHTDTYYSGSYGSCYYSFWGGSYCYSYSGYYTSTTVSSDVAEGGGGGGGGAGAGSGGSASITTAADPSYYSYSYYSGSSYSGNHLETSSPGGGGGGGGLGGGGGDGGSFSDGAAGGYGTGGGGAAGEMNVAFAGGSGGTFGGGGGGSLYGDAGAGGFGGGGGGAGVMALGGAGGFGGGGGASGPGVFTTGTVGGFAGGTSAGSSGLNDNTGGGGGGGAGLGGAIFANAGATLNIGGGVSFNGSTATGGNGGLNIDGSQTATAGQGLGSDLFLMSGTTTGFNIASGQTAVLTGTIADDSANTLVGGTGSGATVAVRGGGTLEMQGQSTIGGGYVVDSSALQVTSTGMIDATGSAVQLIGTGSLLDNAGTLYGDGTGVLANGIDATIVNRAGGVIGSGSGNAITVASGSAFISLDTGSTLNGSIDNSAGASVTARIGGQVNGGYVGGTGSDAVGVDASGHVTGNIDLGGGSDSFASAGTIDGTVDGGDGADTYYQIVDGATVNRTLADLLAGTTNFERFGMAGDGTLVLSGAADASTPDLVAGAGVDEGMLVLDNTSGLTSDIYVNGAVLRVVGDGATGTGTIHMIDPTISFATDGTYANDFALEVASPASADPTVFQVDPGVSVVLTGAIATGSAPGTDPMQYVTIDGSGDVMMTNGANSWTGTTTVNAGAHLIGSSQSISGSGIVNNGTLVYRDASNGTITQDISGTGTTYADSAGTTQTFAGDVGQDSLVVSAGDVVLEGTDAFTGNIGVELYGGTSLTIADGASVSGPQTAVYSGSGTVTVDNQGSISGTNFVGVRILDGSITNGSASNTDASIYGYYTGSSNPAATVSFDNYGVVTGDVYDGITANNLALTNEASGVIQGKGQAGSAYGNGIIAGVSLTGSNDGVIVGRFAGVRSLGTTDFTNNGLIGSGSYSGGVFAYSDGNDGVRMEGGGTLTNGATGQVLGSVSGVYTTSLPATIDNAGLISGGDQGIYAGAGVTVNNMAGGTITGTSYGGINLANAQANSIDNAGDIVRGIGLTGAGTLTLVNRASGNIFDDIGIGLYTVAGSSASVDNAGDIWGSDTGIYALGALSVTNGGRIASGSMSGDTLTVGGNIGINAFAGGTVTNLAGGEIDGGTTALRFAGAAGQVTNSGTIAGGTFDGYERGVLFVGVGGSVINTAGATISGGRAVDFFAASGSVDNAGTIDGAFDGVRIDGDGSVVNQLGGSISGGDAGLRTYGTLTLSNAGSITGGSGTPGTGVQLASGSIDNAATGLISGGQLGILATGGAAGIDNAGMISASSGAGIWTMGATAIDNAGTIAGGSDTAAGFSVYFDYGASGSLANLAGGSLSGGAAGAVFVGTDGAVGIDLQAGSTTDGAIVSLYDGARDVTIGGTLAGVYDASAGTGADTLSLAATGSMAAASLGGGDDSFTTYGGAIGGNVDGGAGSDSLAFDIAGNVAYGVNFTGFEAGTKTGAGRVSLTGVNAINTMYVNGGILAVNGILGSAVTVNSGGTLGGNGTINGSLVIASGGHLAPGNSIGTLHVTGPVTFAAGSTYDVEIDPTAGDQLVATGAVTINGGTVNVLGAAGTYDPLTVYQIISGSSVTGTFAGVVDNLAFLDPTLAYTATSVNLEMRRNDIAFADVANTPNQVAVAGGIQSVGPGALYDVILVQDAAGARMAYDALSGDIHPTTAAILGQRSDRLRVAQLDQSAAGGEGFGLWADASAGVGSIEAGAAGAAKVTDDHRDLLAGVRYGNGGLSLVAGGGRGSLDIEQRRNGATADVDSWMVGGQAGYRSGKLAASVGVTYAEHDIDTARAIRFPGFAEDVTASRNGATRTVYGELAYGADLVGLHLEPFAGASWQKVTLDAATETGGDAALSMGRIAAKSTLAEVGIRFGGSVNAGASGIFPVGTLAWQHLMGDRSATMAAAFEGGDAFTVRGDERSRDGLRANLGLGYRVGPATLALTYDGRLSENDVDSAVRATVSVGF